MKSRIKKIEELKRSYRRQWLLIALEKVDEATTTPISGRLIAHSPHRDEIYQYMMKHPPKGKKFLVEYSEDTFPKGFAAAF